MAVNETKTSKNVKKTGKTARDRKIKALNDYIWSLEGKCESICKVNEALILQYCRFMVLADELSIDIGDHIITMDGKEMEAKMSLYEKTQKLALNLYKVLKLDAAQKELNMKENPFTKMLRESQKDGDF